MAQDVLDILIVGAGLGGLAAAVSCAIAGHHVRVLEGAKELAEIGAGLQVTPNASRLLSQWGLGEEMAALGAEPTVLSVHRYDTGKILAEERDFDQNIRRKYGAPFVDMHRGDLQRLLYNKALSLNVTFRLGARVKHVDGSSTRPVAELESGETFAADLVVGADGLWSRCRESMLGQADKPLPTGDLAYRIVLELDKIDDPELRNWIINPEVHFWVGPHSHVVGYSMRAGKMYNLVLLCLDDMPQDVSRSKASVDEMRALFSGWDPILTRLLQHVDHVEKWKLMHRQEVEFWTNAQKTFVLIGDSCHPMLPYLAQGANSSLEDGAVLGRLLSYVRSKERLPWAINLYERLRKARSESIVRETFGQRDDFHLPDGEKQRSRDALFASQLGKPIDCTFPSRWTCPTVQPWLYGYDSNSVVDEAVEADVERESSAQGSNHSAAKAGEPRAADGWFELLIAGVRRLMGW